MLPTRLNGGSFFSPFDGLLQLRRGLDEMVNRLEGEFPTVEGVRSWAFPMDYHETEDAYHYVFDVPGFSLEDLDVTLENGVLTVSGMRHHPHRSGEEGEQWRQWHTERRFGRFQRSIRLPNNTLTDELEATCRDGQLTVRVPKSQEARPRRIEIGTGPARREIASSTA